MLIKEGWRDGGSDGETSVAEECQLCENRQGMT
jgi:hypothetical protein